MEFHPEKLSVITPAEYRISVVGYLDKNMSSRLGGLSIENTEKEQGSKKSVVTLKGRLADQAALLGVLNALYSMCLPLLSVECINFEELKGEK